MNISKRVYAKVDLDIIEENLKTIHSMTSPDTGIYAVVKADAYGHGAEKVTNRLQELDYVKGFCVATLEEGISLRDSGITKKILILGYSFPEQYEELIKYDITPCIFREDNIEALNAAAKKLNKVVKVHVKVDTGMGRIGITPDEEGLSFVKKLMEAPNIEPEGVFTHFARADETDKSAAMKQLKVFNDFINLVKDKLGYGFPVRHCSNSASILTIPEANMDIVRPGIIIYGLSPSDEVTAPDFKLKPALSLYSSITYLKEVKAGTPISYGGTYVAKKDTLVATVPVGYGDGYPRSLSNKGFCLVRGRKVPIIGRVCMDQFMLDVTDVKGVSLDDEVVLIGGDKDLSITTDELGVLSDRFNYELVCDLGKRVGRIY
ncbi:MAG: alanine racemase [Lachnospiraceae bacterium]|nr:alanine racemase [Lachnospiraceae bacterium]